MDPKRAALTFATLGHPGRLAVFRLLMRFAPRGVRPTEMQQALGLKPNTLSHHLADLTAAGLVQVTRQGRSLFYAAQPEAAEHLIAYLALDVGRGRPGSVLPAPRAPHPLQVLFLCSANSARSVMAEALLRDLGGGRFVAHSAGTRPATAINPLTLHLLAHHGHSTEGLCPKPLSRFQTADAPVMDFVFTVCDSAAAEDCAPWPGAPISTHWGLPDPVAAPDPAAAFARSYRALRTRIAAFAYLPLSTLDRLSAQAQVDALSLQPE